MMRWGLLLSIVLALSACVRGADRPPNVVLILCDDLGWGDVGFNGRKTWDTPTLDAFAKSGTTFKRFYTASVVCAPSRAALMTGRYSIHNGVLGNGSYDLPSSEVTIAEALKKQGYATALFGKWHHGAPRPGTDHYTHPMDQGFDEFFGFTDAVSAWQKFPKKLWDGREEKPVQGYADTLFTDHAIDFIGRHKEEPFFLYLPYICSHGVVEAPEEDIKSQRGKFKEDDSQHPVNATYAAEVVRLDKEVGRILKSLDDIKLADNTIVIFTSDHGATFEKLSKFAPIYHDSNYPFRGQKRTLWEGGMRVPGVIRWPRHVPSGVESHDIMHMCDLFPTILAAVGAQPDEKWHVDGRNMLDVITGKEKAPDRTLYWEWDEGGAKYLAAMRGNLKMIISGDNKPECYDVEADPAERIDRAEQHAKELIEMKAGLDEWLSTTSDAAKQKKPATKKARKARPDTNDL
jgi:arylsulfatase A-like enzyme